jgi:hypothetical protein
MVKALLQTCPKLLVTFGLTQRIKRKTLPKHDQQATKQANSVPSGAQSFGKVLAKYAKLCVVCVYSSLNVCNPTQK